MEKSLLQRLSESAWLTLIPVVATYLAFLFQSSYFSYFGVPISLVEVDLPKIIFAMVALTIAFVLFSVLFAFVADILRSRNVVIQIVGKGLTAVVTFSPFVLVATDAYSPSQLSIAAVFFLLVWLLNFLPPQQKIGEKKTYFERLQMQEDEYLEGIRSKPLNAKQAIGKRVLEPFFLVFFLSLYVMMLGAYCASLFGGSTYLKSDANALYVGRSNGAYIFTKVDPKTNTFGDQIYIVGGGDLELVHTTRTAKRRQPMKVDGTTNLR